MRIIIGLVESFELQYRKVQCWMCMANDLFYLIKTIQEVVFQLHRCVGIVFIFQFKPAQMFFVITVIGDPFALCFELQIILIHIVGRRYQVEHVLAGDGHATVIYKKECRRTGQNQSPIRAGDRVQWPGELKDLLDSRFKHKCSLGFGH